jgi:hypothetical protein
MSYSNIQGIDIYKMLIYKASKELRVKHGINTHHVLVLSACYICSKHIRRTFAPTFILKFLGYYGLKRFMFYFNRLVELNFIALAGEPVKHYAMTKEGINIINQINKNNDELVYSFCNKYNIVL